MGQPHPPVGFPAAVDAEITNLLAALGAR